MKNNNLNNKSNSLSILTPRKININKKSNSYSKTTQEENNDYNVYHTISNKTNYSSFKPRDLILSSNFTSSNENIYNNKICQCLLINNRYSNKYINDITPSFIDNNNDFKRTTNYIFNKTTNSFSPSRLRTQNNKFNINLINTEELTKISTLLSAFKSPKKIKKKKYFNTSSKNFKFGSLLYHLNKKSKLNDNDIQNRYRPKIKEFFGKKDYKKFASKSEKFIRPEELKMLYKDTRLINSIFDYLNNSFLKLRYHQAMINQKEMNELLAKKKNERNYYHNIEKEINLPLEKFLQIKKIKYDKNGDKVLSSEKKKLTKDHNNNLIKKKNNEFDLNLILRYKYLKK